MMDTVADIRFLHEEGLLNLIGLYSIVYAPKNIICVYFIFFLQDILHKVVHTDKHYQGMLVLKFKVIDNASHNYNTIQKWFI